MDSWTGHQSITSTALLNLFGRAAKGDAVFTPGERTLVTLSEFWAAARTGSLLDFLERDTASRLRDARAAFVVIGAAQVIGILNRAIGEHALAPTEQLRRHCIMGLQDRLCITDEPIDLMIAGLARTCLADGWRGPAGV